MHVLQGQTEARRIVNRRMNVAILKLTVPVANLFVNVNFDVIIGRRLLSED